MRAKKVAFLGISVTLAMVLSFIELQLAFFIPIYGGFGIKIGLANLVTVLLLYKTRLWETAAVSFVRVLLVAILFGNPQSFIFSLTGAVLSLVAMWLLKRFGRFHYITVSIVGGVLHNVGQIIAAVLWTQTEEVAFYLPVLLVTGIASGAVIGFVAGLMMKKIEKFRL